MDRKTLTILSIAVVVLAAGVVGIARALLTDSGGASCNGRPGHHYTVVIQNSVVRPNQIAGRLCDTITFTNKDNTSREIAFGAHADHVPYDGVTERTLRQNQSLTITLDKVGSFHFHDHDHDEVAGNFTVSDY